jgi:signal transduction histidine kinase
VLEPLQLLASQKNIEIRNAVGSSTTVFADLNMLKLVLRNLIANGIKFTNPHGVIVISAIEKGDSVDIAVTDNGIGIRKEKIEVIFNKDTLYTTEGTANETGTGLGLMLCKEIIEKHGSEIVVESEEDKGSKISFVLKRTDPD